MDSLLRTLMTKTRASRRARFRPPENGSEVGVAGCFFGRVIDPARSRRGRVLRDWYAVENAAVTVGLNYVLDTSFRNQSQLATWYVGLMNNSGFTGVSASDTMASHSGWGELTAYTEGTRRAWSPPAASGGTLVNTSAVQFTNGGSTVQVKGMFLASDNTKSGTAGTLWATAFTDTPQSLAGGQVFQLYYELDMVPSS